MHHFLPTQVHDSNNPSLHPFISYIISFLSSGSVPSMEDMILQTDWNKYANPALTLGSPSYFLISLYPITPEPVKELSVFAVSDSSPLIIF